MASPAKTEVVPDWLRLQKKIFSRWVSQVLTSPIALPPLSTLSACVRTRLFLCQSCYHHMAVRFERRSAHIYLLSCFWLTQHWGSHGALGVFSRSFFRYNLSLPCFY